MPITELLTRNATYFKDEVALVEINPEVKNVPHVTWREFSLIESNRDGAFRKQLTWGEFEVKANRFANLLLTRGVKKGDKVAILLMNCLDWLPIYFGILKTGALAVPLNFRYTAEEIAYCVDKADASVLVFGSAANVPPLPTATNSLSDTARLRRQASTSPTTTTARFTFHPAQRASPRLYCTRTARSCTPQESSRRTTDRPATTFSSAFPRCTTRALKCTGSAVCSRAARLCCCAA